METAITAIQACEPVTLFWLPCIPRIAPMLLNAFSCSFLPRPATPCAGQCQSTDRHPLPAFASGIAGGNDSAVEYFSNIGAMRKYIADGKLPDLADAIGRADQRSARNFISSIAQLVQARQVAEEVAAASCGNPQELLRALRGISSSAQATRR